MTQPFNKQELACFDKVDAPGFTPKEVRPRHRVLRGLRRCQLAKFSNFSGWRKCLVKRGRPSRKVAQIILDKKVGKSLAHGNFGNLGWARQNIFAIPNLETHLDNALSVARGVEADEVNLPEWLLELVYDDHDLYVAEIRCLRQTRRCRKLKRRNGYCEKSFNEVAFFEGASNE